MECYGAVYARVPAEGVAALEAAIVEARKVSGHSSPLGVLGYDPARHASAVIDRWNRTDNLPPWAESFDFGIARELAELSRIAGEVVALYEIDGGMTMALFGAWRDGALIRSIVWNDGWHQVSGEPQPWEEPLFSQDSLEFSLEYGGELGFGEDEVRSIFAEKIIRVGARVPPPRGVTLKIRDYMKGPAFGFEPWPKRRELTDKPAFGT